MTIDAKYQPQAAAAADAMRAALLAIEGCGADVELTNIVARLADDRTKLCRLFDLPPEQAFQVEQLAIRSDPRCPATLGERPSWMSPDQFDPCRCTLPRDHEGEHACAHTEKGA